MDYGSIVFKIYRLWTFEQIAWLVCTGTTTLVKGAPLDSTNRCLEMIPVSCARLIKLPWKQDRKLAVRFPNLLSV